MRVAERLPERAAVDGEREEREHGRADGDHHGAEADDAGVEERFFERLAFFVHFFDEVEENDDVADDDADEAGDSEERHEAEGRAHDVERDQRADDAVGSGGEHEERLDCVFELECEGQEDHGDGDRHDNGEIDEALLLLGLLAADDDAVAGRKRSLELLELGRGGFEDFGGENVGAGEALHGDGAEVFEMADAEGLENIFDAGDSEQRDFVLG